MRIKTIIPLVSCLFLSVSVVGAYNVVPADNYGCEVVANQLPSPTNLAVNPADGQLFVVLRVYGNPPMHDDIYAIKGGSPEYLFPGSGLNGKYSAYETDITCGYHNEIYVHEGSIGHDSLYAYDIKNGKKGKRIFNIDYPYGEDVYLHFAGMAVGRDDRLYIFNASRGIDVLSKNRKVVESWLKTDEIKSDGARWGRPFVEKHSLYDALSVDGKGNLYLPCFRFDYGGSEQYVSRVDIISSGRIISKLQVRDMKVNGKRSSTIGGNIIRFNPADGNLVTLGTIYDRDEYYGPNAQHTGVFTVNLTTGEPALVAEIAEFNVKVRDLEVDRLGNIYISLDSIGDRSGQIIKICKKR